MVVKAKLFRVEKLYNKCPHVYLQTVNVNVQVRCCLIIAAIIWQYLILEVRNIALRRSLSPKVPGGQKNLRGLSHYSEYTTVKLRV
jgi:hypothetical protein